MSKNIIINRKRYSLEVGAYLNDPLVMAISIVNDKTKEIYDDLTTNLGTNNGNDAVIGMGKSYINEARKDLIEIIEDPNYEEDDEI